jgi:hypothetical protein
MRRHNGTAREICVHKHGKPSSFLPLNSLPIATPLSSKRKAIQFGDPCKAPAHAAMPCRERFDAALTISYLMHDFVSAWDAFLSDPG